MKALLLAGGESRRMGRPKALLPYQGHTLITVLTKHLLQLVQEVIIVTRPELVTPIELAIDQELGDPLLVKLQESSKRSVQVVHDLEPYKGMGPIAGLYSGIYADTSRIVEMKNDTWYTVLACDMPFFSIPLLQRMEAIAQQNAHTLDAVVIQKQPFHGIYHARVLHAAEECLQSGHLRFQDLLRSLRVQELLIDPVEQHALFNMNTPEEYALFLQENEKRNHE